MKNNQRTMVFAAAFLALGILLPMALHWFPNAGSLISPMHIPVLLCGFVCGWPWGLAVGALTPFLSSLFTGMPPLGSPYFFAMIPELLAYGALAGLLYARLPKTISMLYVSLILAMLGGRLVYGAAMLLVMMSRGNTYTISAFLTSAFINAWVAIALHIAVIPPLYLALKRARLLPEA